MTHHALNMYDYHVWANQKILNRLKELPEGIYDMEIQSVFPSLSKVIAHIYLVDTCWSNIISGQSMKEAMAASAGSTLLIESKSLEEIEKLYHDLSERFKAFLRHQDNLEKSMLLDNPYAGLRETTLSEMVVQVVNHGTYHRGNITAMLRQMGHSSVMTEYALFWYSGIGNQ